MSENILVAIIGVIGTIAGALIGGLIQRGVGRLNVWWTAGLGALCGFLFGIILGVQLNIINPKNENSPTTSTPAVQAQPTTIPATITSIKVYGPYSGEIEHDDDNYIDNHCLRGYLRIVIFALSDALDGTHGKPSDLAS
jgi:hypothetical protein